MPLKSKLIEEKERGHIILDPLQIKKRKLTISQIRQEYTVLSKQEQQQRSARFIDNLCEKYDKQLKGREHPILSGFKYSQCLANPALEDSFFTVMPIDYH